MKRKGSVIRKKDKMPAGRDGTRGKSVHAKERILPTHRKKGVKSKPMHTMLTRAEGGSY